MGSAEELYFRLVRDGAVPHMKNSCSPTPRDVKIPTPRREATAAGAIGAEVAERIRTPGVRVVGDPAPLPAVPERPLPAVPEPRFFPEAAARAPFGAFVAASPSPGANPVRTVPRMPWKELVRVLGQHCPKRLGRRRSEPVDLLTTIPRGFNATVPNHQEY
ncbi:hypothetical protein FB157_104355 [Streptomyces sp. BK340]|nr:hypothetical protein FB157_104355 [Streptomyces sp. BK340]